jgi:hypothetical protein
MVKSVADTVIEKSTDDGWKVQERELRPFVVWKETDVITGVIGRSYEIPDNFNEGKKVTVCPVGDVLVNCKGMLKDIPNFEGREIRIVKTGTAVSDTGYTFYTFVIMTKD